jgi:hypothetical protein
VCVLVVIWRGTKSGGLRFARDESGYSSIARFKEVIIGAEGTPAGTSPSSRAISSSSDEDGSLAGLGASRAAGGVTWRDGGGGRLFRDELDPLDVLKVMARALDGGWLTAPVSLRTGGREGRSGATAPFATTSPVGTVRCLAGSRGGIVAGLSSGELVGAAGRFGGIGGGTFGVFLAAWTDSSGSAVQSAPRESKGVVRLASLAAESPEVRVTGGGKARGGTAGLSRGSFGTVSAEDTSATTSIWSKGV